MSQKISAMTPAAALTGAELVPLVQGGANVRSTTAAIAGLATQPTGANPTATAGPAAINGSASTFMRSDAAPSVQLGSNAQFGIVEGDGISITIVAGVVSLIGSIPTAANPTATAGPTAVNGSSAHFMRADAAPALAAGSAIAGPRSLVYKVGQLNTQVSHTGDGVETVLASVKIPAGTLGANGAFRYNALLSRVTAGASTSIPFRIRYGTTNDASGTQIFSQSLTTSTAALAISGVVANRNATNSQVGLGAAGSVATAAIDSTVDTYVVLTLQLNTNSDTGSSEFFQVEFMPTGGS